MTDPVRPIPRSERLDYRPLSMADIEPIRSYRSSPDFLTFYEEETFDEGDAKRFLHRFLEWELERPRRRFAFAAVDRPTGRMVGICSIRMERAGAPWAEIGFELAPEVWGHGLATEMARALLELGFRELGLHRVQAHCLAGNEGSRRVLEKVGMRFEGNLREKHRLKGAYHDELWFGILRPEWEAAQG